MRDHEAEHQDPKHLVTEQPLVEVLVFDVALDRGLDPQQHPERHEHAEHPDGEVVPHQRDVPAEVEGLLGRDDVRDCAEHGGASLAAQARFGFAASGFWLRRVARGELIRAAAWGMERTEGSDDPRGEASESDRGADVEVDQQAGLRGQPATDVQLAEQREVLGDLVVEADQRAKNTGPMRTTSMRSALSAVV